MRSYELKLLVTKKRMKLFPDLALFDHEEVCNMDVFKDRKGIVYLAHKDTFRFIRIPYSELPLKKEFLREFRDTEKLHKKRRYFLTYKLEI